MSRLRDYRPQQLPSLRPGTRKYILVQILLATYLCSLLSLSSAQTAISQTSNVFSTTLTFPSDAGAQPPQQPFTSISIAYPGEVKDRWLPQAGPLSIVPTDCVPTASQTACIGGAAKFQLLLSSTRNTSSLRGEAALLLYSGDWMAGNAFGRVGKGSYAADYLYLMGVDGAGLAAYEYHPELGANYTIFYNRLLKNYAGLGKKGGLSDYMLRTANGTQKVSRRLLASEEAGKEEEEEEDEGTTFEEFEHPATRDPPRHAFHTESLYVPSTPLKSFPLLNANVRVAPAGVTQRVFNILNDMDPTLPNIDPFVVLDYGLDTRAITDGLCGLSFSSCTRSVTEFYGARKAAADAATAAGQDPNVAYAGISSGIQMLDNQRVGVVMWTPDDLTAISSLATLYPDISSRIYSDQMNTLALLQKGISRLLENGVNKVVLLSPTKLVDTFVEQMRGLIGVDVVIYHNGDIYPSYLTSTSVSGSPMLFVSCSSFLLHYCVQRLTFDDNGLLVSAQVNSTVLDNTIDQTSTYLHKVIVNDYKTIFTNASSNIVGYKQYPPKYPKDTSRVRFFETEDGDMSADSGRWIGKSQIGLCNSGALRAILPQGPINLNAVQTMLPFENNWVTLRVSGNLLWISMENSVSLSSISNTSDPAYSTSGRGKFLQLSGMKIVWNPLAPVGKKVSSILVQPQPSAEDFPHTFNYDTTPGSTLNSPVSIAVRNNLTYVPVDPDQYYTITLPSFEAANGDGFIFQGHPESSVVNPNLNTFQVVYLSYLSAYSPMLTSVSDRVVIDTTIFSPRVTAISPPTGDLTITNVLTISGYYLYIGTDASKTKITLRVPSSRPVQFEVDCIVQAVPLDQSGGATTIGADGNPPLQSVRCYATPSPDADPTVTGVRVYVNSGMAISFTSMTPPMFNFTSGSASETCASYQGTLFRNGKCECRAGYEYTNTSAASTSTTPSSGSTLSPDDSSGFRSGSPCQACAPGSYSLDGENVCSLCSAGTFSSLPASSSCTMCPPNTFSSSQGSSTCDVCPDFSITDLNLSPARVRCFCTAGFINQEDMRRIIERKRGIYVDYTSQSEKSLPANQNTTAPVGIFPALFNANFTCTPCLDGGLCDPISGDMRVLQGRWFDAQSATFLPCLNAENCCPTGLTTLPAGTNFPASTGSCGIETDEDACDTHRQGYLCASCASGYQNQLRSVLTGSSSTSSDDNAAVTSSTSVRTVGSSLPHGSPTICVPCDKPNASILTLLAFIALIYLSFVMFNTPGKADYTKILIDFYQMCALCLLPGMLSGGNADASYFQLFHLRIDIAVGSSSQQGTCIAPIASLTNMVIHALIGPILICVLLVIAFCCYLVTLASARVARSIGWWRFRMAGWQLMIFGFMGSISGAFNLLHCKTIGEKSLLVEAPDVECWKGSHMVVAVVAIIVVVLLVLIVPISIVLFVRKLRLRLKSAFLFEQLKGQANEASPNAASRNLDVHGRQMSTPQLNSRVTPSHQVHRQSLPPSSPIGGLSPIGGFSPMGKKTLAFSASNSGHDSASSGGSNPNSSLPNSASGEKIDMEKVARRIYRKSGIVSMVRRGSAMLKSSKSPTNKQHPGRTLSNEGALGSMADILGADADEKRLANADRALNNYGNPLSRLAHYAASSSDRDSHISVEEMVQDVDIELTPFENLLLSHGILFLAYKRSWRWFEGAFLIRRVLFALPYAVTDQATAIVISGWFCSAMFLFHSMVNVFAMNATHRLHNATLICVISLCWLQASPSFYGIWIHFVAWILVLIPFTLAVFTHPWTKSIRLAVYNKCCCCFVKCFKARQKRKEKEEKRIQLKALAKVGAALPTTASFETAENAVAISVDTGSSVAAPVVPNSPSSMQILLSPPPYESHLFSSSSNAAAATEEMPSSTPAENTFSTPVANRQKNNSSSTQAIGVTPLATPSPGATDDPVTEDESVAPHAGQSPAEVKQLQAVNEQWLEAAANPVPGRSSLSQNRPTSSQHFPGKQRKEHIPFAPVVYIPSAPASSSKETPSESAPQPEAPLILVGDATANNRTPFQRPVPDAGSQIPPISAPSAAVESKEDLELASPSSASNEAVHASPSVVAVSPTGASSSRGGGRVRIRVTSQTSLAPPSLAIPDASPESSPRTPSTLVTTDTSAL